MSQLQQQEVVLAPQPGMQTEVLRSRAFELLMGGQAGPGKTWSLLFEDLPDLLNPEMGNLRSLYLRREYVDLGDMIDKAQEMWAPLGAKYAAADSSFGRKTTFTWPNGAKCVFGHMQHEKDKYQYQGFEFQRLRVDELAQFTESQYLYLFSRLRSRDGRVRINVRASCNPQGIGMLWVKRRFVDKCKPGEVRWFARDERGRDMDVGPEHPHAMSRTWIPGDRRDNTYLDANYERTLRQLAKEDYHALALGLWEIQDQPSQLVECAWWDKAVQGGVREAQERDNTRLSLRRKAIGADYAHEGQDLSVVCWGEGPRLLGMEERPRTRTEDFALWVSDMATALGRDNVDVGADGNGPGVGACDMLQRGGRFLADDGQWREVEKLARLDRMVHKDPAFDLKYKGAYKFPNLRSQMWWKFREDMERGRIDLSWLSAGECTFGQVGELQEEVLAHTYEVRNGEIVVSSKKDMRKGDGLGRSPDRADALVIWNWVRRRDLLRETPLFEEEIERADGYGRGETGPELTMETYRDRDLGDGSGWF